MGAGVNIIILDICTLAERRTIMGVPGASGAQKVIHTRDTLSLVPQYQSNKVKIYSGSATCFPIIEVFIIVMCVIIYPMSGRHCRKGRGKELLPLK